MQKRAGAWRVCRTASVDTYQLSAALLDEQWLCPASASFKTKPATLQSDHSLQKQRKTSKEGTIAQQPHTGVISSADASSQTVCVSSAHTDACTQTEPQHEDANPPEHWELV